MWRVQNQKLIFNNFQGKRIWLGLNADRVTRVRRGSQSLTFSLAPHDFYLETSIFDSQWGRFNFDSTLRYS